MSLVNVTAMPRTVFITGTDTGVGKTLVTAALAATLMRLGHRVAVYKPTQAGLENGSGDIDIVRKLTEADVEEGVRLPHPMAPVAAAKLAGVTLPTAAEHVTAIRRLGATHDHILVEGAGGILVELDERGNTLADIATATADDADTDDTTTAALVVCRAALGTLNHTALTIEALAGRGIGILGMVIGSWPDQPTPVELSNREYLARHAVPLLGAIPEQSGTLGPMQFRAAAENWLYTSRLI
jgi:dethiobiotin synthetase